MIWPSQRIFFCMSTSTFDILSTFSWLYIHTFSVTISMQDFYLQSIFFFKNVVAVLLSKGSKLFFHHCFCKSLVERRISYRSCCHGIFIDFQDLLFLLFYMAWPLSKTCECQNCAVIIFGARHFANARFLTCRQVQGDTLGSPSSWQLLSTVWIRRIYELTGSSYDAEKQIKSTWESVTYDTRGNSLPITLFSSPFLALMNTQIGLDEVFTSIVCSPGVFPCAQTQYVCHIHRSV